MAVPADASCLNCGTRRLGAYCHACGQGAVDPEAGVVQLVRESVGDALSWDHRVLRTVRALVTRPGALSAAWAEGRRAAFVSPIRSFLTLGALLVGLGLVENAVVTSEATGDDTEEVDRTVGSTTNAAYWLGVGMGRLGVYAFLTVVPIVGVVYAFLFRKRRGPLAQHLVHALHVASFGVAGLMAWRILRIGLSPFVDALREPLPSGPIEALVAAWMVSITGYAALSVRRFYAVGWGRALAASTLIVAVPVTLVVGATIVIYLALLL